MTEPERYELVPVGYLSPGDVVFMLGRRQEVYKEIWHPEEMGQEWWRVPLRDLDGTHEMAPPFERTNLVPARVDAEGARLPRRHKSPYQPVIGQQDNSIVGLDIGDLLQRLRKLVGAGELIDPELVRQLDSWMSHGYPPPEDWRTGEYRTVSRFAQTIQQDLQTTLVTAGRLLEELRERQREEASSG